MFNVCNVPAVQELLSDNNACTETLASSANEQHVICVAYDKWMNSIKPVCMSVHLEESFIQLDRYLIACVYGCVCVVCVWVCVCGGSLLFPGSLTIWIISASSAFSLWTPGEVAALGHGGTGALQEPHSQLHSGLHCGCGGLRYYKSVSLIGCVNAILTLLCLPVSARLLFLLYLQVITLQLSFFTCLLSTQVVHHSKEPLPKLHCLSLWNMINIQYLLGPLCNEMRPIALTSHHLRFSHLL